ncbi:hypothetical protein PHLCEN_2v8208 [Hermanssonia centrifuga]|uniref:Uncharacterized protein n=1 Tax=Hermanssonia centrifuga TaxID=98765 RepID=A0A2R6NUF3_9APHY|nr:hypothetical protein PHLCEN_2v8208 [Hermanssonia centrifuga]
MAVGACLASEIGQPDLAGRHIFWLRLHLSARCDLLFWQWYVRRRKLNAPIGPTTIFVTVDADVSIPVSGKVLSDNCSHIDIQSIRVTSPVGRATRLIQSSSLTTPPTSKEAM